MKELSRTAKNVSPSPIREMFNRALAMEDVISFTVGEPDFFTPSHIVEAASAALARGEHHYTPNAGILELRKAISRVTEASHGLYYDPASQIIVTAGGMEALLLAMLTILDPGDELILSDPCWTNYSRQAIICGAIPRFVPVSANNGFQFDPVSLEAAITEKTKALIVNSPSNPTGGIASAPVLLAIADIAKRHDLYVISDEVYSSLLYDDNRALSIAALPDMAERTIVINSFSKTYAMTGWRVGYALGNPAIIGNMVKLQENVAACVNSAAQYGALAALEGPQEPLHEMQKAYASRRALIVDGFSKIPGLTCFAPQGAFYAFVDISETKMSAREFALDLLEKARVIVVPGDAFGEVSNRYVRLSFATSEETIKEGLARIRNYMENR
ncbi:MAG: pyridoxal phosphate-dependent aminotransferase [Clostridia bacterium]|nr:pyridoxal phosphate-dependent aminotransferase [Clostridia bacterium]